MPLCREDPNRKNGQYDEDLQNLVSEFIYPPKKHNMCGQGMLTKMLGKQQTSSSKNSRRNLITSCVSHRGRKGKARTSREQFFTIETPSAPLSRPNHFFEEIMIESRSSASSIESLFLECDASNNVASSVSLAPPTPSPERNQGDKKSSSSDKVFDFKPFEDDDTEDDEDVENYMKSSNIQWSEIQEKTKPENILKSNENYQQDKNEPRVDPPDRAQQLASLKSVISPRMPHQEPDERTQHSSHRHITDNKRDPTPSSAAVDRVMDEIFLCAVSQKEGENRQTKMSVEDTTNRSEDNREDTTNRSEDNKEDTTTTTSAAKALEKEDSHPIDGTNTYQENTQASPRQGEQLKLSSSQGSYEEEAAILRQQLASVQNELSRLRTKVSLKQAELAKSPKTRSSLDSVLQKPVVTESPKQTEQQYSVPSSSSTQESHQLVQRDNKTTKMSLQAVQIIKQHNKHKDVIRRKVKPATSDWNRAARQKQPMEDRPISPSKNTDAGEAKPSSVLPITTKSTYQKLFAVKERAIITAKNKSGEPTRSFDDDSVDYPSPESLGLPNHVARRARRKALQRQTSYKVRSSVPLVTEQQQQQQQQPRALSAGRMVRFYPPEVEDANLSSHRGRRREEVPLFPPKRFYESVDLSSSIRDERSVHKRRHGDADDDATADSMEIMAEMLQRSTSPSKRALEFMKKRRETSKKTSLRRDAIETNAELEWIRYQREILKSMNMGISEDDATVATSNRRGSLHREFLKRQPNLPLENKAAATRSQHGRLAKTKSDSHLLLTTTTANSSSNSSSNNNSSNNNKTGVPPSGVLKPKYVNNERHTMRPHHNKNMPGSITGGAQEDEAERRIRGNASSDKKSHSKKKTFQNVEYGLHAETSLRGRTSTRLGVDDDDDEATTAVVGRTTTAATHSKQSLEKIQAERDILAGSQRHQRQVRLQKSKSERQLPQHQQHKNRRDPPSGGGAATGGGVTTSHTTSTLLSRKSPPASVASSSQSDGVSGRDSSSSVEAIAGAIDDFYEHVRLMTKHQGAGEDSRDDDDEHHRQEGLARVEQTA